MEIEEVVIVGSGPVGSFMAVLVAKFGLPVTVYEKRKQFTRAINVKINKNFFNDVQLVLDHLGVAGAFFEELNKELENQTGKVLIKSLEEMFKSEAEAEGVKYVMIEINHLDDITERHKNSNPLILDCSGRNSCLRSSTFDEGETNVKEIMLDSVIYINMTSDVLTTDVCLYPAMKNIDLIKLACLMKCKCENGLTSVTIAASIAKSLAEKFDSHYQDVNKEPLRPFNGIHQEIRHEIFHTVSALISPLMLQGNSIKLDSVTVKKITIACGYAKQRSQGRLVCLGDAAIHLAYFKSLNIGLKHALLFFRTLVEYCKTCGVVDSTTLHKLSFNQPKFRETYILEKFIIQNPHLNPVKTESTIKKNVFMVVTKIIWFGCYSFDVKHRITRQLTNSLGVSKRQIPRELEKLNQTLAKEVSDKDYRSRIIDQFNTDVKMLNIGVVASSVDVHYTIRTDNYMVVTAGIWYGCFWYNTSSHQIERLTNVSGIEKSQIGEELEKLNKMLTSWDIVLNRFEATRQQDIQSETNSNLEKQARNEFLAGTVSLDSKMGLKLYEVYSYLHNGYAIYPGDNAFFTSCLAVVREHALRLQRSELTVNRITLASVQELARYAACHSKSGVLLSILSCQSSQLDDIRKEIKRIRFSKKGGLFQNCEIKLDFAMSCIAYLVKYSPHENDVDGKDNERDNLYEDLCVGSG